MQVLTLSMAKSLDEFIAEWATQRWDLVRGFGH